MKKNKEFLKRAQAEEVDQDTESRVDVDVETVLSEAGEQGKVVSISRQDDKEKSKWHFLTKIPIQDFSLPDIRDTFGGGNYRGRILNEAAQCIKGFSFSIDPRFRGKTIIEVPPANSNLPATQPHDGFSEIKEFLKMQTELIMKSLQALATPKTDPLEMVEKIARILKPAEAPTANLVTEAISMFKQGFDMGRMSDGEGGGYMTVVEKFGEPVLKLIDTLSQKSANGQNVLDKAKNATGETVQTNKTLTVFDQLVKFVPQIINASKAGKDQDEVIDGILDRIPPMFYDSIYQEISKGDFLTKVIEAMPVVKEQEAWFISFVEKFKEALAPETETVDLGEGDNEG